MKLWTKLFYLRVLYLILQVHAALGTALTCSAAQHYTDDCLYTVNSLWINATFHEEFWKLQPYWLFLIGSFPTRIHSIEIMRVFSIHTRYSTFTEKSFNIYNTLSHYSRKSTYLQYEKYRLKYTNLLKIMHKLTQCNHHKNT